MKPSKLLPLLLLGMSLVIMAGVSFAGECGDTVVQPIPQPITSVLAVESVGCEEVVPVQNAVGCVVPLSGCDTSHNSLERGCLLKNKPVRTLAKKLRCRIKHLICCR